MAKQGWSAEGAHQDRSAPARAERLEKLVRPLYPRTIPEIFYFLLPPEENSRWDFLGLMVFPERWLHPLSNRDFKSQQHRLGLGEISKGVVMTYNYWRSPKIAQKIFKQRVPGRKNQATLKQCLTQAKFLDKFIVGAIHHGPAGVLLYKEICRKIVPRGRVLERIDQHFPWLCAALRYKKSGVFTPEAHP